MWYQKEGSVSSVLGNIGVAGVGVYQILITKRKSRHEAWGQHFYKASSDP